MFLQDLFPTATSFVLFVSYMGLFVSQGLLVTASRRGDTSYPFNVATIVLATEVIKLILSTLIFVFRKSFAELFREFRTHIVVGCYYIIPSSLYCLYNNLSFVNLARFDPTTYFIFMQIRLIMTGIIFQLLFKKYLSCKQWVSLILLTFGCMFQGIDVAGSTSSAPESSQVEIVYSSTFAYSLDFMMGFSLILLQACSSVFAGVYNEYIIKKIGSETDIILQNIYMYVNSVICNFSLLVWQKKIWNTESDVRLFDGFQNLLQFFVVAIIINNSVAGIVTSLFLKNLNSILKAFASALELVFTALLSFLLLGIPIYWNTIASVAIVSVSVVMYARNPVVNNESDEKLRP